MWLKEFPAGVNHDEVDVILSAKTYWKFGTDLSGVSFPKSLAATKTDAGLAGLPSFFLSPLIGPVENVLVAARIIYLLTAALISLFIFLLIRDYAGDKKLAYISLFVSAASPWLFFYGRSPTEAPFALLFALIGTYLFLKDKVWKKNVSLIFFIAAFYSYQGAKIVIPALVLALTLNELTGAFRKKLRFTAVYLIIFAVFVSLFFWGTKTFSGGVLAKRGTELNFGHMEKYQEETNVQRRISIVFPGNYIHFNKYSNLIWDTYKNYVGAFSPGILFVSGDPSVPFSEHGLLFAIDFVLIIFGLVYLAGKPSKIGRIMLIFAAVAPMASAVSLIGSQYIFRAFLLLPVFVVLISSGIYLILKKMRGGILSYALLIFVLAFSYANFLMFFFFRYPVDQEGNHFVSERVLANYLMRTKDNVTVVTDFPYRVFYEYAFFSGYLDNDGEIIIPSAASFTDGNISITDKCPEVLSGVLISKQNTNCGPSGRSLVIQSQKDAGTIYKIYGDTLCRSYPLTNWRENAVVNDYNIEVMDEESFCKRWIFFGE
ncbi:MAG TPA: hypothetical protein VJ227_03245 [Patescibacteria group bacterium]|nr:hypothetical protein [Patescibacteria group bacterium]